MELRWLVDSLHGRLLLALTLIAILPLTLIGVGHVVLNQRTYGELSAQELEGLARGLAGELELKLDQVRQTARVVAAMPEVSSMDGEQAQSLLELLFLNHAAFTSLHLVDSRGQLIAAVPERELPPDAPAALAEALVGGTESWTVLSVGAEERRLFLVTAPVRSADRALVGAVVGTINLQDLSAPLRGLRLTETGRAFVLDETGHVVLHPQMNYVRERQDFSWLEPLIDGRVVGIGTTHYQVGGSNWVAGYAPVVEYGWSTFVERSEVVVLAPALNTLRLSLIAVGIVAILSLVTALFLARTLILPINQLVVAARAFGSGDIGVSLPVSTAVSELRTLASAFSAMREAVVQREQALFATQQRLSLHLEQTPMAVIEWNPDLEVVGWNPAAETIFGFSAEDVQGRRLIDLVIPPASIAQGYSPWQEILPGQPGRCLRCRNSTKDGRTIYCEWYTTALVDDAGQMIGVAALAQDITARVEAEEQLRLMNSVVEHMSESVIICSAATIDEPGPEIVYVNHQFTTMTGYSAEYALGKTPRILQGPQTNRNQLDSIRRALSAWEPARMELINYRQDGSEFWGEQTIAPIRDAENWVTHWVSVQRDISERKGMERVLTQDRASLAQRIEERTVELQQANQELARAAAMKDVFLANMSHELRTPLNAILGITEALQEQVFGDLNPRQLKSLGTVESSGRHLLSVINDILDLSMIEAGQLDLERAALNVEAVCRASLQCVQHAALQKEIQLRFKHNSPVQMVEADDRRLKQILVNLLNNAVKFTPNGGAVGLDVTWEPVEDLICLAVWDTGIGIDGQHLEHIFQPFTQLDSSLARQFEGTGLGLALVRRMVELLGGRIRVESQLGRGSRFIVTLPAATDRPAEAAAGAALGGALQAESHPQSDRRPLVLVADDNEQNIYMFQIYLTAVGYEVAAARDGLEAVAMADEMRPDIILMDIQMPRMDGLQAIQRIREYESLRSTPVIAVTALAMPGDRERCLAAGANGYFSKPLQLKELTQTIELLIAERKATPGTPSPSH